METKVTDQLLATIREIFEKYVAQKQEEKQPTELRAYDFTLQPSSKVPINNLNTEAYHKKIAGVFFVCNDSNIGFSEITLEIDREEVFKEMLLAPFCIVPQTSSLSWKDVVYKSPKKWKAANSGITGNIDCTSDVAANTKLTMILICEK